MKVDRPKRRPEGTADDVKPLRFRPHDGQQMKYFNCDASIILAGGGAGGGKTHALLMDALRGLGHPGYEAAMFRKTRIQHAIGGGLRNESQKYYSKVPGSEFNKSELQWDFPHDCHVKFYGCDDPSKYDGLQCAFLGVDQLEQLTAEEFWHLQSRVRTQSKMPPRIRATCNPEPGWLERLLKSGGYVGADGLPVPDMDGKIRWFVRDGETDEMVWRDDAEAFGPLDADGMVLSGEFIGLIPDSFTFIRFRLEDNPSVSKKYRANLQNMTIVERRKKLEGNWNAYSGGGGVYRSTWWGLVDDVWAESKNTMVQPPAESLRMAWGWDIGWSTSGDWTVGVLMGQGYSAWYLLDMIKFRAREHVTFEVIRRCMEVTGREVPAALPHDPGKAGLDQEGWQFELGKGDFQVHLVPDDGKAGDKVARHRFLSPQAETGHLKVVRDWRPTREVSFWVSQQETEKGTTVECSTVDDWAREAVQCLDALSEDCSHVITDVTDAVCRAHRFMTVEDPAGAARLAAAMSAPASWSATDPRARVAKNAVSQWARVIPGQNNRTVDRRDFLFDGRRRY